MHVPETLLAYAATYSLLQQLWIIAFGKNLSPGTEQPCRQEERHLEGYQQAFWGSRLGDSSTRQLRHLQWKAVWEPRWLQLPWLLNFIPRNYPTTCVMNLCVDLFQTIDLGKSAIGR